MRLAFRTFGCRSNTLDTDVLYAEAIRRGHTVVEDRESADAYIINSCTVTQAADREARVAARRFKTLNPAARVAVIGCYAQVGREELKKQQTVDFIVGTADKVRVLDLLESSLEISTEESRDQVAKATGFLAETFPGSRNARAAIKIQDGCNFCCSFCIIPKARGRSRSLRLETVVEQVLEARHAGFLEVVLTGIHLAHYGWDCGTDLVELVHRLVDLPDGPRIRLSTLDPFEIPRPLIALLNHPKFCPHFHIALQSGSDAVLKDMRRIYRAASFTAACDAIETENPDTFIGVDVIVGFPGETEERFQETVSCLQKSHWSKLHVFPFSVRKGTRAELLPDHVPPAEIARRSSVLRKMSDERLWQFHSRHVGRSIPVVMEKASKRFSDTWVGHSDNYMKVFVQTDGIAKAGQLLNIRVERAGAEHVWGSPYLN